MIIIVFKVQMSEGIRQIDRGISCSHTRSIVQVSCITVTITNVYV